MIPVYVYLAGPITNCTENEAHRWRDRFDDLLNGSPGFNMVTRFVCVNPLRCEPILGERYGAHQDNDECFGAPMAIGAKNRLDVQRADVVVAYFPKRLSEDVGHISVGTMLELGWSIEKQKTRIVVSDIPYIRDNAVLKSMCPWILAEKDGFENAAKIIKGVYSVYTA